MITASETRDNNAFKEAYDGGLEKFTSWLESLSFYQRQQLLELIVDKTYQQPS